MRPFEVPDGWVRAEPKLVSEALDDLHMSSGRGETSAASVGESGGSGQGDHSGELRRGRRECFDEQVIDVRVVGVVHLGCYPRPCGAYSSLEHRVDAAGQAVDMTKRRPYMI